MIIKERDKPIELYQFQALFKRLAANHPKKEIVHRDLKRKVTEINGVKAVDFPLQFIEDETLILHDVRIPDHNGFFQMDVLLLNWNCIIILEIKNWYGTILFEENGQVIRISDDKEEEGFPNPVLQAKLQRHRLRKWLNKKGYFKIPILFLVVISFPSTILKTSPTVSIPDEVIHANQLIFKWKNIINDENLFEIPRENLQAISADLLRSHTQSKSDLLGKYDIDASELMKGIFCESCNMPTMRKNRMNWFCSRCNFISKDAHVHAILDYKLLINPIVTNKEMREFLRIECKHIMKRILQKEQFKPIDSGANRKYKILL